MSANRIYLAIDLKSFYASVECVERGLDPLTTNLVVADLSRTDKTICLAVSPSLKAYGIPGRARLFEVVQKMAEVNAMRQHKAPGQKLIGSSFSAKNLAADPTLALDYIAAPPRMAHYMQYSTRVYEVYLKYVAPEDIHVYSIDEVFIDATTYLPLYKLSPREFATRIIRDVLQTTGITATAGIGTNLYLSKVAMDIVAKHVPPDQDGVRIARLNEASYRRLLWDHRPLTDFWRVGKGYAKKLEAHGLYTMGDIARCSLGRPNEFHNEGLLYKLFGVNAELLIDHAWGWEPCTMKDIKNYRPAANSISTGQVLHRPYTAEKARLVVKEMTDLLVLDLVEKGLLTDQVILTVGYDIENLTDPVRANSYTGDVVTDFYGRRIPKHAHTTIPFGEHTASTISIMAAVIAAYDRVVNPDLLVRRITLAAGHVVPKEASFPASMEQLDLFGDYECKQEQTAALAKERSRQEAILRIKHKYGKNAILRGMNLEDGATAIQRNNQIGGHKA